MVKPGIGQCVEQGQFCKASSGPAWSMASLQGVTVSRPARGRALLFTGAEGDYRRVASASASTCLCWSDPQQVGGAAACTRSAGGWRRLPASGRPRAAAWRPRLSSPEEARVAAITPVKLQESRFTA
jgi:hypothetical protein